MGDQMEIASNNDTVPEKSYPRGFSLVALIVGVCLGTFIMALDNTIIATAIPSITTDFDSLNDVGWYGSAYLLTTTALQPTFGKIYTNFSVKWTFLAALVLFEIGSTVCATALSSPMLIAGRAIAGVGASALFSGSFTIVASSVSLDRRAFYIALLTAMFGIASVIGPLLGGVFTDRVSWRWCFWINLPLGFVTFLTVLLVFKSPSKGRPGSWRMQLAHMDWLGSGILIAAVSLLLLALQWGGATYPWSDSKVWGCVLGFALLSLVFIGIQYWKGENATIPLRMMRQRSVAVSCIFTATLSMGIYTHVYYLPFYFQAVKGSTAEESGIHTIPYVVTVSVFSLLVGAVIPRVGYIAPFMWAGMPLFIIGAGLVYTLQPDSDTGKWIGYQLLTGIGAGTAVQIPFIAAQLVNPKDIPTANSLIVFFNSLGGALAISIAQSIFSNSLYRELQERVPSLSPSTIISAGATGLRIVTPSNLLSGVVQAYSNSLDTAYILPVAVGAAALLASTCMPLQSVKQ